MGSIVNRNSGKAYKKLAFALVLVVSLAASLRLAGIGSKSLWMDEIITVLDARLNWVEFIQRGGYYPFLFFFFEKLSTVVSESPFWVRLPSLFAGVASVYLVYVVSKPLFGRRVAVLSAFLMAISPLGIYYSQEARTYAFLIMFDLLGRFWVILAVIQRRQYAWYLLVATCLLGVMTTYLSGISVISLGVWILLLQLYQVLSKRVTWKELIPDYMHALIAGAIAILAWYWLGYPEFVQFYEGRLGGDTSPLSYGNLFYQYGRIVDLQPLALNWFVGLGLVGLGIFKARKFEAVSLLLTGLLVIFVVYRLTGIQATRERYYLLVLPYVLIAVGVAVDWLVGWVVKRSKLHGQWRGYLPLIAAMAFISAGWLVQLPHMLVSEKVNYRDGAGFVEERLLPGDIIVQQSGDEGQFQYYFSAGAQSQLRRLTPSEMAIRCQGGQRVWLTGSHILGPLGEKQFAWARDNMDLLISFPAFAEWGVVDVYLCGSSDVPGAMANLEQTPEPLRAPRDWLQLGELLLTEGSWERAIRQFDRALVACATACSEQDLFRIHLGLARAYEAMGDLEAAIGALGSAMSLPAPDEYIQAYAHEIAELYRLYVEEYLDDQALLAFDVPGGSFEAESDLKHWQMPKSQSAPEVEVTPDCAAFGEKGVVLTGPSALYHGGIRISLPFEVREGQYYAVDAYIRAEDNGHGLRDHLWINPLYLSGRDRAGNYHRSSGEDAQIAAASLSQWRRFVRVFQAREWMDGTLDLSPALLQGRGSVCIDHVFALPLSKSRQMQAGLFMERKDYAAAIQIYQELLAECIAAECPNTERLAIVARLARAKAEQGTGDEALVILEQALRPSDALVADVGQVTPEIVSLYETLLMTGDLLSHDLQNGGFEDGLEGWSLPAERYKLTAEITQTCAYRGQAGLLIEGAGEEYHNGPSVALPFAEAGHYYVVGAMIRPMGNVVDVEGMYLGGRDEAGEYHGLHGGPDVKGPAGDWQPIVRLVLAPDWVTSGLRLSPILLTGEGPVCLDEVFARPLTADLDVDG